MITDDFDLYYDFKFLESVIFCDASYIDFSKSFMIIEELKQLEELVIENRFMFDEHAENNICTIIQDLRYIEDEYTIERGIIINNIINSINAGYDKKENYDFYRHEMCKRFNTNKYRRLNKKIVDSKKELIDVSIALDSAILHSHTIDLNSFNEYFEDFVDNSIYLMSIRAIINEFPNILNNEIFLERLSLVLNNSKDNKKIKSLKKDIKRIIKK